MLDEFSKYDVQSKQPHVDLMKLRDRIIGGCKLCGGIGHINEKQCSCMVEMLAICNLDKSGAPREYWEYNLVGKELLDAVAAYKSDFDNWKRLNLIISGPYRCGKTTIAVTILKEFYKNRDFDSCFYTTSNEILASVRKKDLGEQDFKFLNSAAILVIDEIGKEACDQFDKSKYFYALDSILRSRRGSRATILITNFKKAELKTWYGENFALIFEHDFIHIDFPDDSKKLGI